MHHHPFKCNYRPKFYSICLRAAFILAVMSTHPTSAVRGADRYNSRAAERHLQHTELYMNAPTGAAVFSEERARYYHIDLGKKNVKEGFIRAGTHQPPMETWP